MSDPRLFVERSSYLEIEVALVVEQMSFQPDRGLTFAPLRHNCGKKHLVKQDYPSAVVSLRRDLRQSRAGAKEATCHK